MSKKSDLFDLNYNQWYTKNKQDLINHFDGTTGSYGGSSIYLFEIDEHNDRAEELFVDYVRGKLSNELQNVELVTDWESNYATSSAAKFSFFFYFMTIDEVKNTPWKEKHRVESLKTLRYHKLYNYIESGVH